MISEKPTDRSNVMREHDLVSSSSPAIQGLEGIRYRLRGASTKEKVDALLEAFQYGHKGIDLVIQALGDGVREVRESALLLLSYSSEATAEQALWNYLPFAKMQCLHTLTEFNLDCYKPEQHHPYYFAIADYNNTLICYWDLSYKQSFVNIWDLETGQSKKDFDLAMAHEFGLGKSGKVCIISFQHFLWPVDTETQEPIGTYPDYLMNTVQTAPHCLAVCSTKQPLLATGYTVGKTGELEIWDYETYTRRFHHQFQDWALVPLGNLPLGNYISPLLFTPDGKLLVAYFKQRLENRLQLWNRETGELIQTLDNVPAMTVNGLANRLDGQILACGIREKKVCVWELISDRILYTSSGVAPCLMSSDGRVLIYCTDNYEIVVWDLAMNRNLCTLQGHTAPISYVAMSSDRNFIASYSIDRTIKIWGVPESLRYL
ncbi:WD40 repeat domain-containing protein [Nostoc sp. CALU 546]|uniref:WD40 repeat domain-containing protein n=1 Tax=Nostoc sp. CALU 546 TaxID=1867241 RepID=UPI003B672AC4